MAAPVDEGPADHLIEVKRYGWCVPCRTERKMKIGGPHLELTRDPPTASR